MRLVLCQRLARCRSIPFCRQATVFCGHKDHQMVDIEDVSELDVDVARKLDDVIVYQCPIEIEMYGWPSLHMQPTRC